MPTSKECNRCLTIGVHSRLKRVYYRLEGKYTEVGWICPSCLVFTLDTPKYLADYNEIFGTDLDEEKFKKQLEWINFRIRNQSLSDKKLKKMMGKFEEHVLREKRK